MARRSMRLSSGGGNGTKHKRVASGSSGVTASNKKPKREQSTPKKSQYFEKSETEDDGDEALPDDEELTASEFEESDEGTVDSEQVQSDEDEISDDEPKRKPVAKGKGREVWRPGVKAGLGPGNQVVIKKPKARSPGKIPYAESTIHPNTLLFLADLKNNNDRQWLKLHDAEFRQAEKDWHSFVEKMTEKLTEIDDTVPELPVKDVVFRIYRDVRFSADPTPYKPLFSAAWSRTGRKSSYAHYYVQIAPGKSFVGGGLWYPEPAPMAAMRAAIHHNSRRLKDVLVDEGIRKEFLTSTDKSPASAVKAFVRSNQESALKTKPKGYDADHADIDLLRLRSYTLGHGLTDEEVLGERGMQRIAHLLACLKPLITYCNQVVMPDEDEEDEQDGDVEQDASEDELSDEE